MRSWNDKCKQCEHFTLFIKLLHTTQNNRTNSFSILIYEYRNVPQTEQQTDKGKTQNLSTTASTRPNGCYSTPPDVLLSPHQQKWKWALLKWRSDPRKLHYYLLTLQALLRDDFHSSHCPYFSRDVEKRLQAGEQYCWHKVSYINQKVISLPFLDNCLLKINLLQTAVATDPFKNV